MKIENMLTLGVVAGVGYVLYDLFFKKGGPGSNVVNAVAGAIATPYVAVTNFLEGSYNVSPTGNVILPNGSKIPLSSVAVTWDQANNVASFVYQGFGYIIAPGANGAPAYDANGDYHAQ